MPIILHYVLKTETSQIGCIYFLDNILTTIGMRFTITLALALALPLPLPLPILYAATPVISVTAE